jgi:hypothetical protein
MRVILQVLLVLILLAAALVFLVFAASLMFGFGFGVRVGGTMYFRELSRIELMTILGTTVIVAFVSLVLLKSLRAS